MLEPLGQSQVLPYVRGLTRRGFEFDLIAFEQADSKPEAIRGLKEELRGDGISYHPLVRARDPRFRIKVKEATQGILSTLRHVGLKPPRIIHGRSYFPTAMADAIALALPRSKVLFDCRGMLGDEYVDSGYWTRDRFEYKLVKAYESRIFHRAEGVVVLTEALRKWVVSSGQLGKRTRIEAIPCCVDVARFHFDEAKRAEIRRELGIEDRLVLVYSGSLGGMYCDEELAKFAGVAKQRAGQRFAFLILSRSPTKDLEAALHARGVTTDEIFVRSASPTEVPGYLSAGDAAMVFGKDCFARMGCSPTKLPEYFACGLSCVVNDFGDQADVAKEHEICVLTTSFEDAALAAAADKLWALAKRPVEERAAAGRRIAEKRYGLESVGVSRYEDLYRHMAASR